MKTHRKVRLAYVMAYWNIKRIGHNVVACGKRKCTKRTMVAAARKDSRRDRGLSGFCDRCQGGLTKQWSALSKVCYCFAFRQYNIVYIRRPTTKDRRDWMRLDRATTRSVTIPRSSTLLNIIFIYLRKKNDNILTDINYLHLWLNPKYIKRNNKIFFLNSNFFKN